MSNSDCSTDEAGLTPEKRPKTYISSSEKRMVLHLYQVELESDSTSRITEIVRKTANTTGVSTSSVYRILREHKRTRILSSPERKKARKSIFDNVDDTEKAAIKRKVHDFYFRNEKPTLQKMVQVVNEDPNLPNFQRTTFYKLLCKIGFRSVRRGTDSMLVEKDQCILRRRKYLRTITDMRLEGRKIYYLAETRVDAGPETIKSTGNKSLRKKSILIHIGSEAGFIKDGLHIFESEKIGDHHEEMNAEFFEDWFASVLDKLEENSVVVVGNTLYSSRKKEKIPTASWNKELIKNWLFSKQVTFDDSMLKTELLDLVRENKMQFDEYVIDEMAAQENKIILRLPPYHNELNPMGLVWARVKTYATGNKSTFELGDEKRLLSEAFIKIGADEWKNCFIQTMEVEKKMWELDEIMEKTVEAFEINLDGNSSDSEPCD